jgi:hypothetical protein
MITFDDLALALSNDLERLGRAVRAEAHTGHHGTPGVAPDPAAR